MGSEPTANHLQPGPSPKAKGRVLSLLLAAVAVAGLATIPWQRRQWAELQAAREDGQRQRQRLAKLQSGKSELETLEKRLADNPADIALRLDAARTFLSSGNTKRAAELLQQTERDANSDTGRQDTALAAALATLYERIGWQDKALFYSRRCVEIEPRNVEHLLRIAFLEGLLGWQKDCQAHVREATRLAPDQAEPHLSLALIHDQIGGMSESERELRTADRLRSGDWRIQLLLARNLMGQKRFDDALVLLEKILEANPNEGAVHAAAADALLQQIAAATVKSDATIARALRHCRDYHRIAPDSPEAQFLLGKALMETGDRNGAREQWEAVYERQPDFGKLRISLGNLLVREGDRTRGARLLQEARNDQNVSNEYHRLVTTAGQNRQNPDAHRNLARHCMQHGRLPRAIVEWEEVLRLLPGDKEATQGILDAKKRRGDVLN